MRHNDAMANKKRDLGRGFEAFKEAVGVHIARLRKDRGLTQLELADRTELHRTHISQIENGQKDLNMSTLYRLAKELEVRPGSLIDVAFP